MAREGVGGEGGQVLMLLVGGLVAVMEAVARVHVRPRRIAPLAVPGDGGQRLDVVRQEVDDEPALGEPLVDEGDARRVAHERVPTDQGSGQCPGKPTLPVSSRRTSGPLRCRGSFRSARAASSGFIGERARGCSVARGARTQVARRRTHAASSDSVIAAGAGLAARRTVKGTTRTIGVGGELELAATDASAAILDHALQHAHRNVVADLSAAQFIDVASVRTLAAQRQAASRLVIIPAPHHVHQVSVVCGVERKPAFLATPPRGREARRTSGAHAGRNAGRAGSRRQGMDVGSRHV